MNLEMRFVVSIHVGKVREVEFTKARLDLLFVYILF